MGDDRCLVDSACAKQQLGCRSRYRYPFLFHRAEQYRTITGADRHASDFPVNDGTVFSACHTNNGYIFHPYCHCSVLAAQGIGYHANAAEPGYDRAGFVSDILYHGTGLAKNQPKCFAALPG